MAVNDQFFNIGNNPNLDAADTGIDPATGRILTPAERKKIFKSRILSQQNRQKIARTSKMAIGGGALVLAGKGAIEEKRVQAEGGALVAPVNNLTKRVDALESSIASIQTSLANIRKVIIKGNEVDAKIQEELAKQTFSVSVGGEMVKMTFNGKQEAKSIEIDPEIVDPKDIETLQDLILSAVNEGLRKSQQNMQNSLGQQIGKMTGGMDFSSLLNPKS